MIGCTFLSTGADSKYGTDSRLGTNSSPGIDSTLEPIPSDSDSISFGYGSNSGSGSTKNGIITSLVVTRSTAVRSPQMAAATKDNAITHLSAGRGERERERDDQLCGEFYSRLHHRREFS